MSLSVGRNSGRENQEYWSSAVGALADAGFAVTEFLAARPEPAYEDHEPERYEAALEQPDTLCVRAVAPPAVERAWQVGTE